jgi:hypothetical protein
MIRSDGAGIPQPLKAVALSERSDSGQQSRDRQSIERERTVRVWGGAAEPSTREGSGGDFRYPAPEESEAFNGVLAHPVPVRAFA